MADESTHPSMAEILDALDRLADRISAGPTSRLDGFVALSMRRACEELCRFIPGLDAPPDPEAARFMARAAHAALEDGNAREALSRALRGLSLSPHHPGLWFIVATCCFEFGAVEDAVRALRHTLWIHPGHRLARRDLKALTLYLKDRWEGPGEGLLPDPSDLEDQEYWRANQVDTLSSAIEDDRRRLQTDRDEYDPEEEQVDPDNNDQE